jgi:hypothetical protein
VAHEWTGASWLTCLNKNLQRGEVNQAALAFG